MMHTCTLLLTLWIAMNANLVNGNYQFVMHLHSFENPTNTVADGSCCAATEGTCTAGSCEIGLRICLRPAGFSHSDHSCPLLEIYRDAMPRIGQWALSGAWPGSIQVYIRSVHIIGDHDKQLQLSDDLLIDDTFIELENLTSFSPLTPEEVFIGSGERAVATLQFQVVCESNCYGELCDVVCSGRDDAGGHYRCNRDGEWECLEGYQNPETNCTECATKDGCMNGYCDNPLSCLCLDGWSGDLCNECVPSANCSSVGGYCETAGECLCRDGYSGDNCDIAAISSLALLTTITSTRVSSPSSSIGGTSTVEGEVYSTMTSSITPSFSAGHSMTFSFTSVVATTTLGGGVIRPTVGGVVPRPDSMPRRGLVISLTVIVMAAVGGFLLLLMIVLCIASFITTAAKGRRKRTREIYTAGMTHRNGSLRLYAENRLLESATPTSSDNMTENNVSFMTFTNETILTQSRHELHVYYHRNTPEPPPASSTGETSREAGSTSDADDGDRESQKVEMETVEMDFPSSYLEEGYEHSLHWSSLKSDKESYLFEKEEDDEDGTSTGQNTAFNEYQLY